jgi:hypothetical protein
VERGSEGCGGDEVTMVNTDVCRGPGGTKSMSTAPHPSESSAYVHERNSRRKEEERMRIG